MYSLVSSKWMYVCMEGKQSMYSVTPVLSYEQIAPKICSLKPLLGTIAISHTLRLWSLPP